ncbi:MAG: putative LPS assembly protein LptD [Ignavibacteria bacterium]|nr:putative LPS assembly protein LptD [Ignavibacteria bacterium]
MGKKISFCFLFFTLSLFSQSDSLKSIFPGDSLLTKADSSFVVDSTKKSTDIDSIIYSSAKDSIIFFLDQKKMHLYGSGDMHYKDTQLKSGKIIVDFETSNVESFSLGKDSSNKEIEPPVLVDKNEEYKGMRMRYNFKTSKGYITYAASEIEQASYSGAKIKKVDKQTFFIENGVYSTCTLEHPHYYFFGNEMKMIQKQQLIGKWIWLAFGDVPFPIPIPFIVFPLESGRRSGLLAPAIGERAGYGRYFSRFGYFWAISDYMDLALTSDYYTKGGYTLDSRFRYLKRYDFTGNLEASYSDLHQGERTDPDYNEQTNWRLRWVHNQTITPSSGLDVNLEFMSGDYFKQNSADYSQLLRQQIVSSANYRKSWEESGSSISLGYRRNQDLSSGDITEDLPTFSFSKSQMYPFKRKKVVGEQKWYELIGLNYNNQFQNNRIKVGGQLKIRGGVRHSLNISASPKFGYINISPSVSYQELWYNKRIKKESIISAFTGNDTVRTYDMKQLEFVRTFSMGVSASTKLFGIYQPQKFGIAALRHTILPSISYNFTPDFSENKWGYYSYYYNSKGEKITYNKYEREIYGGASSGESQSLSFSLGNIFEMKTMTDRTDTTSKEQKIQLLNLNAGIGYNFVADSIRFSDLNLSYRTQVGELLSVSGSSTYSLYDYNKNGDAINKFLIEQGKGLLRLRSFNFSLSTSFSGDKLKSNDEEKTQDSLRQQEAAFSKDKKTYRGIYDSQEPDFTIPWSISLNYNYSESRYNPYKTSRYTTISSSANISLTKYWKISVSGSYDITGKQFSAPQIMISRDLHCWLMNFTWNPIGTYTGYRLEVRVKAPQLQDLKVTKTDNFFSGR